MQEVLIEFINDYGYLGIALLICIENIFPPIPSELILVFGGFMTTHTTMNIWLVILTATIGSTLGAAVLYQLGRALKKERLKDLFSGKFGRIMHLKPEYVDKADRWFVKYEYKAVLFCRCIPLIRSFISLPAGISEMRPLPFFFLTILGSTVWNTVLVLIGAITGDAWELGLSYISLYSKIALIAFAVILGVVFLIVIKKSKKNNQK